METRVLAVLLALCCFGAAVEAAPGSAPAEPKEDSLNNYMDLVIENLNILILENGYDPVPLPNATTGFSDTVLWVEWHGEAALYDGWLRGLSTIYRSANAEFIRNDQGTIVGISTGLGIQQLQGHYKCLATFMDLGPHATVELEIDGVSIFFAADLDQNACRFELPTLEVTNIGHISVDIHGLGPLNWIFEIVVDLVLNVVKSFITSTIEDAVSGLLNDALEDVDLTPIGGILGCEVQPKILPQPRKTIPFRG